MIKLKIFNKWISDSEIEIQSLFVFLLQEHKYVYEEIDQAFLPVNYSYSLTHLPGCLASDVIGLVFIVGVSFCRLFVDFLSFNFILNFLEFLG